MNAAARDPHALGAATEARIAAAIEAHGLILPPVAAAELLGETTRTLRTMTDEGLIRAVRKGKGRGYIEADIRAYLAESTAACRSDTRTRAATSPRSGKVVPFSERRGARPAHDRL